MVTTLAHLTSRAHRWSATRPLPLQEALTRAPGPDAPVVMVEADIFAADLETVPTGHSPLDRSTI